MKKLLNKKNSAILGILFILLGIPLITFILKDQTSFKSGAENSQVPQNIKITNISNNSFAITYQTEALATGSTSYGIDRKLGESELDDTDKKKGSFSPKKIHSISVAQLLPATKYYLTIISGVNTYLNNGAPFEITTGKNISSQSAMQNTIKGKLALPDGNPPLEAVVYLSAENSQLLSSTTGNDGTFSFSLKELRINDLSSYFEINNNTVFKIIATDGQLTSTAQTSLSQGDTIPTITLSNNYDFAQEISTTASISARSSGFPTSTFSEKNLKPEIVSPKDKQSFNNQKPQFRGTSLPNEKVEITIHSAEEITTQVTADANGNWTYQPPTNLSLGEHTITIKTRDSSGILTTIMQSFTVFAAETQVPTPIPNPTTTSTPSALPSLMPLPIQTPILLPLSTVIPDIIPSPILAPIDTTKGGLPPTGSSPTSLIIGGIISTISGLALFLLTRGAL